MRQTKKILMIAAVLLIFACQASAIPLETISSVNVVPTQPLDTDFITFNISGWSVNSGWVEYDQFSQNGTSLQLDLHVFVGIEYTVTPWTYTKQIQPLAPNNYSLEVRAFDYDSGVLQDTYNTGFTVTPEPCTLAILGFALPFFRAFSRRKS